MKKQSFILLLSVSFLLFIVPQNVKAVNDSIKSMEMYIPLGQVSNREFKVYVRDAVITKEMNPKLIIRGKNNKTSGTFNLVDLAPNQTFSMKKEELEEALNTTGTLLLFKINKLNISNFKPSIKVMPVLVWENPARGGTFKIINSSDYFIGHGTGTTICTIALMSLILLVVGRLLFLHRLTKQAEGQKKERVKGQFFGIICDENGQVSMSLLQMGLWTIAVASMVLAFGLLRLSVPRIPDTLITLMLFAAGTSTLGQYQSKIQMREDEELKKLTKAKDEDLDLSFWEKLSTMFYTEKKSQYPSIAKIQVLAWTVITLILFMWKSINEGELWEVPNQLVILMGISQATFLGRQQMAIEDVKKEVKANKPASESNTK